MPIIVPLCATATPSAPASRLMSSIEPRCRLAQRAWLSTALRVDTAPTVSRSPAASAASSRSSNRAYSRRSAAVIARA